MKKRNVEEIILQLIFFVVGLMLMICLLGVIITSKNTTQSSETLPVSSLSSPPSVSATETATTQSAVSMAFEESNSFFTEILKQANHSFANEGIDQEGSSGFALSLLSFMTGIDIANPTACLESQIRLLSFADPEQMEQLPQNTDTVDDRIAANDPQPQKEPAKDTKNQDDNTEQDKEKAKDTLKTLKTNAMSIKKTKLDNKKPLVFIYHSHTTESFKQDNKGKNFAPQNPEVTVDAVGERLSQVLEQKYGIATLHDSTVHDYPKRLGAYTKSRPTIQQYLKKYSSLKLVIDLHRDGDVPRIKCTAVLDGKNCARTLLVAGQKFQNHASYNKTTQKFKAIFDKYYPDFCRGIDYKNSSYNQDLSSKMILLEIGSNENSLAEALNTTEIVAKVIAKHLGR